MHTEQPSTSLNESPAPDDDAVERAIRIQRETKYYDDLVSFGWWSIGHSIILSGGAYPAVLIVSYFVLGNIVMLFNGNIQQTMNAGDIFMAGLLGIPLSLFGGILGILWFGFVTIVTLPVMHLIVWSLKIKPNWVRLGAFCGGLVAFLAVFPLTMQIPKMVAVGSAGGAFVAMCMGPGLATIVGQIGGARGGDNAAWRLSAKMASRRSLLLLGWNRTAAVQSSNADETELGEDRPAFQFRTIHLLWVGVWLSLLLTMIRLSGIPYALIIPVVLAWLVYQAATLVIGRWLVYRLGPWWRGERQIRST